MFHHIINNIKGMVKKEKVFIIMLSVVQILSVIIMLSAYGIINHYNVKLVEVEGSAMEYSLNTPYEDGATLTLEEVRGFLGEVLPVIEKKLDNYFLMGKHPDMTNGIVISGGEYADGRYLVSERFRKYVFPKCKGNVFTDEMYTNADKVVILGNDLGITEEYVTYGDEEYKVTARYGGTDPDMILFPYTSIPVETMFSKIELTLNVPLTQTEYNSVYNASVRNLHNKAEMPDFDGIANTSDYRVYKNMILIIAGMVTVCGINYCIIYKYLINKNRRAFAIIRICGCTKGKATAGYVSEMIAESIITYAAGVLLFRSLVQQQVVNNFEYARYYYGADTYTCIFLIYTAVLLIIYLIQIVRYVKATPSELIREV